MPLFAVHIPDSVLSSPWLIGGFVVATLLVLAGLVKVPEEQISRIGLLTSALFVASLLHIPTFVGSVHLLLNAIAGILLGRFVGIAMLVALTFQAFLFAHGGLSTLGVNTAVMGLPAIVGYCLFVVSRRKLVKHAFPIGIAIGCIVSTVTVLFNGAIIWFGMPEGGRGAAVTVLIWHLPVIAVESVGTGVLLSYLVKVKPDWLGLTPQSSTGVTSSNGTSH